MREAVVSWRTSAGSPWWSRTDGLLGVLTAGDLTRLAEREPDFLDRPVGEVMTRTPKTAAPDDLAAAAVGTHGAARRSWRCRCWTSAARVVGVVHLHDLMRAGAV